MALFDKLRRSMPSPDGPEFTLTGLETIETITNGKIKKTYVLIDESGKRHKFRSAAEMPPGVREQFEQWEVDDRIRDALVPPPDISTIYPTEWGQMPPSDRSDMSDPSDKSDSRSWSHKSERRFVTIAHPCPDCGYEINQTNPKPGEPYTCPNCRTMFVDAEPGQSLEELQRIVEGQLRSPEMVRAMQTELGSTVIADGIKEVASVSSFKNRGLAVRAREALKDAGINAVLSFDIVPEDGEAPSTDLELCVPVTDGENAAQLIEALDLCEPYAVAAFTDAALGERACEAIKKAGLYASLQPDYHDEHVGAGTALLIKPREWEKVRDVMEKLDMTPHDILGTYNKLPRAQEAQAMLKREGIEVLLHHVTDHPQFGTGTALLARPSVSEKVADLLVQRDLLPNNLGPEN